MEHRPLSEHEGHFEVDKMHAAHRQLNWAIWLHFNDCDPVAVLTLAGAASVVFANLVAHRCPERSWDKRAAAVMGLTAKEYFAIVRRGQNFLKHADEDPEATLSWSLEENEAIMMNAVMEAGELDHLSPNASVFQFWYIAKHPRLWSADFEPLRMARQVFPGLEQMSPPEQRAFGARVIESERQATGDTLQALAQR